jgi:competence protein ComEA
MKNSLTSEHKALIFVGCIGMLGAGVRLSRAIRPPDAVGSSAALPRLAPGTPQPALERQIAAADSAAADTGANGRPRRRPRKSSSSRRPRARIAGMAPDSSATFQPSPIQPAIAQPGRGSDDMAHIAGKLDVDAASAAQLDSLPGVGPALANRILADRAARGPFGSMSGFMRVAGIGPATARKLQELVTFSGVSRPPGTAADSLSARRRPKRRVRSRSRPPPLPVS